MQCKVRSASAGVFNVVSGDFKAIGEAMLSSEAVRKIGFTGSTKVGKYLMERSAATVKRVSMELGGNAPFIVFEDADLEAAAKAVVGSGLRNAGQTCVCANRILVQESIHDKFADILTKQMASIKVGDGMQDGTQMGPCINEQQVDWAKQHVDDAVKQGAKVLCGGQVPDGLDKGFFYGPTLLGNATPDMRVFKEETFAPVIPLFKCAFSLGVFVARFCVHIKLPGCTACKHQVQPAILLRTQQHSVAARLLCRFSSDAEAVKLANDTPYGLAAYFFSKNLKRVWDVSAALEYGMIGVNEVSIISATAPFGGVKQSGLGRENGPSGIDEFLEEKYICMGLNG